MWQQRVAASGPKFAQTLPRCMCSSSMEPEVIMHFLCSCYKWTLKASSRSHVCERECFSLLGGGQERRETVCLGWLAGEIEGKEGKMYPHEIIFFFPRHMWKVKQRGKGAERSNFWQKYKRKLERWQGKWIWRRRKGSVQQTAGEVVAEMEKSVVDERGGRNRQKSRAQV